MKQDEDSRRGWLTPDAQRSKGEQREGSGTGPIKTLSSTSAACREILFQTMLDRHRGTSL